MLVKDVVYSVLDLSKAALSDDSIITEELVVFLIKKYRNFLIKKDQDKEKASSNNASEVEYQEVCLDLEKVDGDLCISQGYLRTTEKIPKLMDGYKPSIYPVDYYVGTNISFIPRVRMRYVGTNKFLQNIIYVSYAPNEHLYLTSSNPQFFYLRKIRMSAVFDDFEEANKLLCDEDAQACDVLDMELPLREHLVPPLIELIVNALVQSTARPADWKNDANDNLDDLARGKND